MSQDTKAKLNLSSQEEFNAVVEDFQKEGFTVEYPPKEGAPTVPFIPLKSGLLAVDVVNKKLYCVPSHDVENIAEGEVPSLHLISLVNTIEKELTSEEGKAAFFALTCEIESLSITSGVALCRASEGLVHLLEEAEAKGYSINDYSVNLQDLDDDLFLINIEEKTITIIEETFQFSI